MSDIKIFTDNVESEALGQIYTLAKLPAFADCKIRIMPDVHAGAGCVIGFTADMGDKVIPNIVGVDIGCGMYTVELGNVEIDYERLDSVIRQNIPSGRAVRDNEISFHGIDSLHCKDRLKNLSWIRQSMGSLGGGNHFIEIDEGEDGTKYLIIHTGSRNLGKQVAQIYQAMAVEDMQGSTKLEEEIADLIRVYKEQGRHKDIQRGIAELKRRWKPDKLNIPKELCYLTGDHREMYLHDMRNCQEFAWMNRKVIADIIMDRMGWAGSYDNFHTIHNYIDHKSNIVRKGAISAKTGERVLIPMNMRDGCIIGIGKGNEDWNCSAPHGAGRLMSRSKAKETLSLDEFKDSMKGIFTTSCNRSTIDESPMAYKPMDEILKYIGDTVEIEQIIKPVYNFKASE